MIRGIFGKIFSKWVVIPVLLLGLFFGFAYWRGYSPMETIGKIPVIGSLIAPSQARIVGGRGRATVSKTETAEEVASETPATKAENPLSKVASVGSQALQVSRPARSQIWDVFEHEVGFGTFQHPVWVWVATVLSTAVVVIPLLSWGVKRIVSKTGITIHRPDDPKTFVIQTAAVSAIGVALLEVFHRYGALAGFGVVGAGVAEFLIIQNWRDLPNSIKEIGRIPLADFLKIIVEVLVLLARLALLLSTTFIPVMTAGSFLAPGRVTTTKVATLTTTFTNAIPAPIDVVGKILAGPIRLSTMILDLVSFGGYSPIALVALSGFIILLLVGIGAVGTSGTQRGRFPGRV